MKITGLLDRNKITIRRQRRSRQRSNYTPIPWMIPTEKEAAAATIRGRRPSPDASYLPAASKTLPIRTELATRAEALKAR